MSYADLPDDLRSRSLEATSLQADVVDLMLGVEDRRSGALALLLCNDQGQGVQPLVLTDLSEASPVEDLRRLLDLLLPVAGETGGGLLVGRGRRRGLLPTELDRSWHRATVERCTRHRVRLLGFYLAAPEGVAALNASAANPSAPNASALDRSALPPSELSFGESA